MLDGISTWYVGVLVDKDKLTIGSTVELICCVASSGDVTGEFFQTLPAEDICTLLKTL